MAISHEVTMFLVLIYMLVCTHNFKLEIQPRIEKGIVYLFGFLLIICAPIDDLAFTAFNVVIVLAGLALFFQKKCKQNQH